MLVLYLIILTAANLIGANNAGVVKKVLDSNVTPVNVLNVGDKKIDDENIDKKVNVDVKAVQKLEDGSNAHKLEASIIKKEDVAVDKGSDDTKDKTPHVDNTSAPSKSAIIAGAGEMVDESKVPHMSDDDFTDITASGFYFFAGISGIAIVLIMLKIYRMRLSRTERKYGVQGDRSTQELTPLPVSIEDVNSDEDDQTLFEINRQQIRIL